MSILKRIQELHQQKEENIYDIINCFLSNIEKYDDMYNVLIKREQYDKSAILSSIKSFNPDNILNNIPIVYKDNISVKGRSLTCASRMCREYISSIDSTVFKQLQNCSTIDVGRANMDELAVGSLSDTGCFGPVISPCGFHTAGGSSGGSAVAVATNMCVASLGTDTGGSVRYPSEMTNLVGLKPTYGSISRYGVVTYASSLDTIGIMAHYAEDIKSICEHIQFRQDPRDTTSCDAHKIYDSTLSKVIGIDKRHIGSLNLSQSAQDQITHFVKSMESIGYKCIDVDLDLDLEDINTTYARISRAELYSSMARFDGVKYGYRSKEHQNYDSFITQNRSYGFGREVRNRIVTGAHMLFNDRQLLEEAYVYRRGLYNKFCKVMKKVGHIILPGVISQLHAQHFFTESHYMFSNLVGNPAISFPIKQHEKENSISIQLLGNFKCDIETLNVIKQYQHLSKVNIPITLYD